MLAVLRSLALLVAGVGIALGPGAADVVPPTGPEPRCGEQGTCCCEPSGAGAAAERGAPRFTRGCGCGEDGHVAHSAEASPRRAPDAGGSAPLLRPVRRSARPLAVAPRSRVTAPEPRPPR